MSDLDKQYEHNDKKLQESCLKIMNVKALAVRERKAHCLDTRRGIEDILAARQLDDTIGDL